MNFSWKCQTTRMKVNQFQDRECVAPCKALPSFAKHYQALPSIAKHWQTLVFLLKLKVLQNPSISSKFFNSGWTPIYWLHGSRDFPRSIIMNKIKCCFSKLLNIKKIKAYQELLKSSKIYTLVKPSSRSTSPQFSEIMDLEFHSRSKIGVFCCNLAQNQKINVHLGEKMNSVIRK